MEIRYVWLRTRWLVAQRQVLDGVARTLSPHFPSNPNGWIVAGPDCPLDKVTVKKLTLSLALPKQIAPACISTWERRLGSIDWHAVDRQI